MADVAALGELLIDFVTLETDREGYPTMAAHPGGAPANFLASLRKYGCSAALIAKVGADAFGAMLINTLQKEGINTDGVVIDDNVFTTLAFVTLDASGNREFSFARKPGADTKLRFDEIPLSILDECKVFHFGALSLTDEPSRSATHAAVAYARARGKWISFDPNLRLPLWKNADTARKFILWGIQQADIVKMSDEEAEFLWRISPHVAAEKIIHDFGAKVVYITLGAQGCHFQTRRGAGSVPCPEGICVRDTTGAGDIFSGAAMSRLLALDKELDSIAADELKQAARFACAAASLSTSKYGGISSVAELAEVMEAL